MSRPTDLEEWLAKFVEESLRDEALDRFVQIVDEEILHSLPELAADPVLVADLHRSTRHQWMAFLGTIRRDEHTLVLPEEASDLARSLARRRQDVRVLLRVYLSAHHGVFAYLSEAIGGEGTPDPDHVLKTLWRRADLWMDESVETLIEIYYAERQRNDDGNEVRRAELIENLVSGTDVDLGEAERLLGHPMRRWHTAMVAWSDRVDSLTPTRLHAAVERLAKAYDGGVLLTHLASSRDLWCWVATTRRPADLLSALEEPSDSDIRVAAGLPGEGPEGFRDSHTEARLAQRLAMAAPNAPRLVPYLAVEMLSLAFDQRAALERMVRREASPLCGTDRNLAALRQTVLSFLAHRMNVEATAEELHVHGNTVRYRIARAEELLGRPLAEQPQQLELALQYVELFGAP